MRVAFASQVRWRVRAALTVGDVGYALDLAKFSCRIFGPSATAAVLGSRYSFGASQWRGRAIEAPRSSAVVIERE